MSRSALPSAAKAVASTPATHGARLPLSFAPNLGQGAMSAQFVARGYGYVLALAPTAVCLQTGRQSTLTMTLRGANAAARLEPLDALPGHVNYLVGNDPARWRTDVPTFVRVRARGVYLGIDVVYYGEQRQWEYDFAIAPGGDPRRIELEFTGARDVEISPEGELLLRVGDGAWRQQRPVAYQECDDGAHQSVNVCYVRRGRNRIGLEVGPYDRSRKLVIDPVVSPVTSPVVSYATYLGGTGNEEARAIAVDAAGNAYVAGVTSSTDFPVTAGTYATPNAGAPNAFVAKLNPAGTAFIYTTYFGGGSVDFANAIAIDSTGAVYLAGRTESADFPTTSGTFQRDYKGADAFVAKLNPAGTALVYSTLLGGTGIDEAFGIAVDAVGNAHITGNTRSTDFPVSPGAYESTLIGKQAAFVVKLNASGGRTYATYHNLSGDGDSNAIAVDARGYAIITGKSGRQLPGTNGGLFVTRFNPNGEIFGGFSIVSSSFQDVAGTAITADAAGNVYLAGYGGKGDGRRSAFVNKLDAQGLIPSAGYSFSGSGSETSTGIALDSAGNVYVTGRTSSPDFPTLNPRQAVWQGADDVFVTQLSNDLRPRYSTYLGTPGYDIAYGIGIDAAGNAYIAGITTSNAFPVTPGAAQPVFGGGPNPQPQDTFIAKLAPPVAPATTVSAATFDGRVVATDSIVTAFGSNLATTTATATTVPLPTTLGGTTVKLKDYSGRERLAPLFYVSPTQVNFLMTAAAAPTLALVTITNSNGESLSGTALVDEVAPGLFTASGNGQGLAAALALRVRADGSQQYEEIATFDAAQNKFIARPIDLGPADEQVFLVLFGTGIRNHRPLSTVRAAIGGANAEVLYVGPQGALAGLDQINLRIPRSLIGRGETDVVLGLDSNRLLNVVRVSIK